MSKQLYLANVGRTIFMDCGNSRVIGMADTLTQATYNLTVQEEELRGGPGNPLLASTFHDQTMELSFTDALISTDMIGAMIGATGNYSTTGTTPVVNSMFLRTTTGVTSNEDKNCLVFETPGDVSLPPVDIGVPQGYHTSGTSTIQGDVCYVRSEAANSEWELGILVRPTSTGGTMKIYRVEDKSWSTTSGKYCIKYFHAGAKDNDVNFNLNADFVPSVLHAISYIDVYEAGTAACSGGTGTSTGRAVGQLIIDIPLFQLNNGLNLQLSTTPGTYDISGKALAKESSGCTNSTRTFGTIYYSSTTSVS